MIHERNAYAPTDGCPIDQGMGEFEEGRTPEIHLNEQYHQRSFHSHVWIRSQMATNGRKAGVQIVP